jgi:predicted NBD/HSP70 family sugar kinase
MIAALDLGGTKLAAARVQGGGVLEKAQAPTPSDRSPRSVVGAALELLEPFLPGAKALGVAATGTVREGKVTAPNQETLPWTEVDLAWMLQDAARLPTFVLNDADAAAWGEARFGAGRGVANFLFVTVSTGIGSGLVLEGRLHQGSELGFTRLEDGRFLEHAASGSALDAWARGRGLEGAAQVVALAATDPEAAAVLEQSAQLLAAKLLDLGRVLNLGRVAVGGGLGLAEPYLERLRRLSGPELPVVRAVLGAEAGLIGAAEWAERGLEARLSDTHTG